MIVTLRVVMFLSGLPLLAIAGLIAVIDGASARAIRRAEAGREYASLYHRAKIAQLWSISIALVIYLGTPVSVNPVYFIFPAVVVCGFLIRTQVALYKKYA